MQRDPTHREAACEEPVSSTTSQQDVEFAASLLQARHSNVGGKEQTAQPRVPFDVEEFTQRLENARSESAQEQALTNLIEEMANEKRAMRSIVEPADGIFAASSANLGDGDGPATAADYTRRTYLMKFTEDFSYNIDNRNERFIALRADRTSAAFESIFEEVNDALNKPSGNFLQRKKPRTLAKYGSVFAQYLITLANNGVHTFKSEDTYVRDFLEALSVSSSGKTNLGQTVTNIFNTLKPLKKVMFSWSLDKIKDAAERKNFAILNTSGLIDKRLEEYRASKGITLPALARSLKSEREEIKSACLQTM